MRGDQRRYEAADRGIELVDQRQLLANLFEINDLRRPAEFVDQGIQLAQLDKPVGRDDPLIFAVLSALLRPAAPLVKFSIAGTRP